MDCENLNLFSNPTSSIRDLNIFNRETIIPNTVLPGIVESSTGEKYYLQFLRNVTQSFVFIQGEKIDKRVERQLSLQHKFNLMPRAMNL